jgi:hypothetical protein
VSRVLELEVPDVLDGLVAVWLVFRDCQFLPMGTPSVAQAYREQG